jgi:hypothetical protein
VVESSGFRDTTLLDDRGLPHSEALHLTERFMLGKGGKTMTVIRSMIPRYSPRPWTAQVSFLKKPADFELPEEVCAEKLQTTAPKRWAPSAGSKRLTCTPILGSPNPAIKQA